MKKYFIMAAFLMGSTASFVACNSDDEEEKVITIDEATDLDYSAANAKSWNNYALNVAQLLRKDAQDLNTAWGKSYKGGEAYANTIKAHNNKDFPTALSAIEQIVDGCCDIANEVGTAKIGAPLDLYNAGKTTEALYAVESWYSWHSIDDYSNNIVSIQNALLGTRGIDLEKPDHKVLMTTPSILGYVAKKDHKLMMKVFTAVKEAKKAIQAIPAPFRNNINSQEARAAQEACANLDEVMKNELKPFLTANAADEAEFDKIVTQYVNNVVLPTYADLATTTEALYQSVAALQKNPSNAAFENCAKAWLAAREPWETSEAFLFGPVADLGLDPNMDSWPLDQVGLVNVLNSGKFDALTWKGEYDEENKAIEAAQSLRGFHTLEYLIFKDGKARTIK